MDDFLDSDVRKNLKKGLAVLEEQGEGVSQLPMFAMMRGHLEGAKAALENIQASGMIPQEYPDTEPGLSEPGMDAEGYDNVAASATMAAEALAGLMAQVYELGND